MNGHYKDMRKKAGLDDTPVQSEGSDSETEAVF
jgi:hypothetical protein